MLRSQRRRTLSLKPKYQHRPSFTPVCNSPFQPETTLFSLSRVSQHPCSPLSLCPRGAISGLGNKQKILFISAIGALNEFTSRLEAATAVAAEFLDASTPTGDRRRFARSKASYSESTPASPFSLTAHQLELRDSSVVYACMCARA